MGNYLLIDGNSVLYREIYSGYNGPRLVEHFLSSLQGKLTRFKPTTVAIMVDSGRSFRRKEIFPGYKENRVPLTEAKVQERLETLRNLSFFNAEGLPVLSMLGAKVFEFLNREGDDVVALAVRVIQAFDPQGQIIIESTDSDLYQLITPNIQVATPSTFVNLLNIQEITGLPHPRLIPLYKALAGDRTDNIMGVYGVGEKLATGLLCDFFKSNAHWDGFTDPDGAKIYPVMGQMLYTYCQKHKLPSRLQVLQKDPDSWTAFNMCLKLVVLDFEQFTPYEESKVKAILQAPASRYQQWNTALGRLSVLGCKVITERYTTFKIPFQNLL